MDWIVVDIGSHWSRKEFVQPALSSAALGKPRYKKNGKKKVTLSPFGDPSPPKWAKRGHLLSEKKSINRDKCVFATKERMFRVLAIIEILHYRGLPIPDPTS